MHIPDGFLNAKVSTATAALALLCIPVLVKKLRSSLGGKAVPLLGVTAAFVFASQMVNFPIPGGASGHMLGAALCAVVLGPVLGILSMTLVLAVQCFLLQDGGVTALGANILNMAVCGVTLSWLSLRLISAIVPGKTGLYLAVAVSSWLSVVAAAFLTSLELGLSSAAPFSLVVPAMIGVHAVIGVGEAVLTSIIAIFLYEVDVSLLMGLGSKSVRES